MWSNLSVSAKGLTNQLMTYYKAIQLMSRSFNQIYILLDFSQWMINNQFPVRDVVTQFTSIINLLLTVEYPPPSEDDDNDDNKSTNSKSSKGSKRSRSSRMSKHSRTSRVSRTSRTSRMSLIKLTARTKNSNSNSSTSYKDSASSYISAEHQDKDDGKMKDVPKRLSNSHYEMIIFIYYYLGYISTTTDNRFDNYMTALLYVMKTYQSVYETLNYNVLKPTYDAMPDKEKLKISFENWRLLQPLPYGLPPANATEYQYYEISDKILEDCSNLPDDVKSIAFTPQAYSNPKQSVYYLSSLYNGFIEMSLPYYTFPILKLEEYIITKVLENEKPDIYTSLLYIQYAQVYNLIGLDDKSQEYIQKCEKLLPTENLYEIMIRENELYNKIEYSNEIITGFENKPIPTVAMHTGYELYRLYIDIGEIAYKLHENRYTNTIVSECLKLCQLRNDKLYEIKCNYLLASILYEEGEYNKAMEYCQRYSTNDIYLLAQILSLIFTISTEAGKGVEMFKKLKPEISKFDNIITDPEYHSSFIHIESMKALFYLKTYLSINLLKIAYNMFITNKDYNEVYLTAIQYMEDCKLYIIQIHSHPEFIPLLILQIQALQWFISHERLSDELLSQSKTYLNQQVNVIYDQIYNLKGILNHELPSNNNNSITTSPYLFYYIIIQSLIGNYYLKQNEELKTITHQKEMEMLKIMPIPPSKTVVEQWFYDMDINNRKPEDFSPNIVEKTLNIFSSINILSDSVPIYHELSEIDLLRCKRLLLLLKQEDCVFEKTWKEPEVVVPPEEPVEETTTKGRRSKTPSKARPNDKSKGKSKSPVKKPNKAAAGKGKKKDEVPDEPIHVIPPEYSDRSKPVGQLIVKLLEIYDKSRKERNYEILEKSSQDIYEMSGYLNLNLFLECMVYNQCCKVRNYLLEKFIECGNIHNRECRLIKQYLDYRTSYQHPKNYIRYYETIKFLENNSTAWQMTRIHSNINEMYEIIPLEYLPLFIHFDEEKQNIYFVSYKDNDEGEKVINVKRQLLTEEDQKTVKQLRFDMEDYISNLPKELLQYSMTPGIDNTRIDYQDCVVPDESEEKFIKIMAAMTHLWDEIISKVLKFANNDEDFASMPILLFIDPYLSILPFESLPILSTHPLNRDFSLSIFFNRMKIKEEQSLTIPYESMNYVVDPYTEFASVEVSDVNPKPTVGLIESFNTLNTSISGGKINSITGTMRIASNEEYIGLLTVVPQPGMTSLFGFYGPGKWISYMGSDVLCGIHNNKGNTVFLCDNFNNELSSRRYSKEKNMKTLELMTNENIENTIILLTLNGITTIYVNQWETSYRNVKYLMNGIYNNWKGGNDLTNAVQITRNEMDKPLPEAEDPTASGTKSPKESKSPKNAKSPKNSKPPTAKSKKGVVMTFDAEDCGICKNRIKYCSSVWGIGMLETGGK